MILLCLTSHLFGTVTECNVYLWPCDLGSNLIRQTLPKYLLGLESIITRPGSASENTIYADLAFAASSPGLEKMAILNHIYQGDKLSIIAPDEQIVCPAQPQHF